MNIAMPKIGKQMQQGVVTKWLKAIGDYVEEGELLFEMQWDNGVTEIEAPVSGILSEILVEAGNAVPVKEKLAVISEGEAPASASEAKEHPKAAPTAADAPAPQKLSPLAKKLAADIGVDPSQLPSHGRVLAQDVLEYLKKRDEATPAPAEVAVEDAREEIVPMNGMRKAIAKNMLSSHMTSPTVTFNLGIDMTAMKQYREQLKANDIKVSYTDLLVKFVAQALTEFPLLNCSVAENKIVYKHYVNMGVAVALPNGLVVPNVTDADKKSLTEISAEVKELASLAREGKLPPDKLRGGTFTITNLGMYGIESFTPIINQPEVAILGVNTMADKPVVVNGQLEIRPIMNLSLTADHRVVDGSVAAQFLQRVKQLMENPALILA